VATASAPAHFLWLELIDLIAGRDGGLRIRIGRELAVRNQRLRRQRRRLCAGRKCDTTCRKSKGEFQKVPALHDISSSAIGWIEQESFGAPR
jgi:hypothetical protein